MGPWHFRIVVCGLAEDGSAPSESPLHFLDVARLGSDVMGEHR